MNYNAIMKMLNFFKINDSYKSAKTSLFFVILTGFLSYNLLVVYRVADPDTIIEGLTYYINATWAIVGCGRWMLPIVNILSGNVIMPYFVVFFYCFCMWLCAFLIAKIWRVDNTLFLTIAAVSMTVTPAAISQLIATYMGECFALACLFSVLFVYFCFESSSILSWLFSTACIVFSLALYQSYISMSACLVLMTLCIYCLKGEEIKTIVQKGIKSVITALAGGILYVLSNKIILGILKLESSSRLAEFSIGRIFQNLPSQIVEMYRVYFSYFNDPVLLRKLFYALLFVAFAVSSICSLIKQKQKPFIVAVFVLCVVLIPLAANLIGIATPDNPITVLMTYQNILVVPFTLAVSMESSLNIRLDSVKRTSAAILSVIILWTHMISANATYECYKMSHDHVYNQYSQLVYDVQHYDGYIKNETPVLIAGFFDDKTLRNNIKTYRYAVDLFDDLVFWDTLGGATYNRHRYVLQYFGLDFIDFSIDEYKRIINTDEFKEMSCWPEQNGMRMIDGYLVIKIADNYAR